MADTAASLDCVPNNLRNLRACLLCSLVKTFDQFEMDGCDNCDRFLQLKVFAREVAYRIDPTPFKIRWFNSSVAFSIWGLFSRFV